MGPPPNFKNVAARSRAQRRAVMDKESLEKARLRERTGGPGARMDRLTTLKPDEGSVTTMMTASCGYLSEADRFHNDVAGEERLRRMKAIEDKQTVYDAKRMQGAEREENRWIKLEEQKQKDKEYWNRLREAGDKARRNKSSVPYNALTLKYDDGLDGQRLKFSDDKVNYRAAVRADNLQSHNNLSGFNPITGQPAPRVLVPSPPQPSEGINL